MASVSELEMRLVARDEASGTIDKVNRKLDGLDTAAGGATTRMAGLRNALGLGLKVAGGIAIGTFVAVGAGLTKAVSMGSDAQEMLAKFGVVFANTSDQLTADLQKIATETGRSRFELMEMASTFGDTLKPMGFTEEAAAATSAELVALATDLSSFNNMPMDEALRRLQGTLVGSHENALAFGVVINENTLKAEMAAQGWDKLTGAELEAMKVQARINLLMAGTVDAQGDAIRTSESWANQTRALKATLSDAATEIGLKLLPALTPLLGALIKLANDAVPHVINIIDKMIPVIENMAGNFNTKVVPAIKAFGDIVKRVIDFVKPIFQSLGATVDEQATGRFEYFRAWIDENLPRIQQIVGSVLNAIMAFWNEHGETIMTVVTNTFNVIFKIFDTTTRVILEMVQFWLQVLTGDFEGAGETLKNIASLLWDNVKEIFRLQLDTIKTIFTEIDWMELGKNIIIGIASGIFNAHSIIIDAAQSAAKSAFDAAKGWLGIGSPSKVAADEIGKPFAQGIAVGIGKELSALRMGVGAGLGGLVGSMGPQPAMATNNSYSISVNMSGGGSYENGRSAGRGIIDELRARGLA